MTPTVGTLLAMTSASGTVHFSGANEEWSLPLVGFAVVVTYVDRDLDEYETRADAVVLVEGRCPVPLSTWLCEMPAGVKASVEVTSR